MVDKMERINLPKQNKFGYYEIWYKIGGKWNKISCKTKDYSEAVKFFAELEIKLNERKNNNGDEKDYLKILSKSLLAKNDIKPQTKNNYKPLIKRLENFIPHWNKEENPDLLNAFLNYSLGKYSPLNVKVMQTQLRELVRIAKKQGLLPANYNFEPIKIKIPKRIPLNITPEDFEKLYYAVPKDLKNLLLFDYHTGLRISDICNLKWENVDLIKGELRLKQIKTGNEINLPLLKVAVNILKELYPKRKSEYVFTHNGERWNENNAKSYMAFYCKKVFGENKYHFHTLRYTFAQKLLGAQIPLEFVKEFLGHTSINSTMHYINLMNALKEQIEKINNLVYQETERTERNNLINFEGYYWN